MFRSLLFLLCFYFSTNQLFEPRQLATLIAP